MGDFCFLEPEWVDEAGSTNDVLKQRLEPPSLSVPSAPAGTVFAARRQTKGRGRLGNVWQSASSGDLTFSFIWRGRMALEEAGTLSLACGLAVRDFLLALGINAACKWPNDVFVNDAKICGIIIEGGHYGDPSGGELALVAGIGVNCAHLPGRDAALGRATASIEACLGRAGAPEALLPALLRCLEARITAWQAGGFAALRADMDRALWGRGGAVRARTPSGPVDGVVHGLGEKGELLVRAAAGDLIAISSVAALDDVYSGNDQGKNL